MARCCFFSSRRRHTRFDCDWSSDVCSSDLTASAFPVATMAQRVWGGAWVLLLFALLNSAIALSIACFNGGTRTWYAMGRSGVLPKMVGKVNPTRKTPVNAISLQVGVQVLAFACVLIWG